MRKIYVLGSINTDLVINAPRFPNKGETIAGADFFTAQGGKGANQAVAACRLGGIVKFCACVGNDNFGSSAINNFKKEGIDCSSIKVVNDVSTGTAIIIVCNGENSIVLDSGANNKLDFSQIDSFLNDAQPNDIFLCQLEVNFDAIEYSLKIAKEKQMFVVLNPAPFKPEVKSLLKYCDLITPNEGEYQYLLDNSIDMTLIGNIIVTLGGDGYRIINQDGDKKYPCLKIKPIDTTAAGDTFVGGLAAFLSNDNDLISSAKFGSLAASLACLKKGAQPSIPSMNDVMGKMKDKNIF